MATYRVTTADGQEFEVDGPENMTDAQVAQAVGLSIRQPTINFDRSDDEVRSDIERLPETDKQKAYNAWAKHAVGRERAAGFTPLPDPSRGIPVVGGLIDEGAALVNSGLHTLTHGAVGRPYDEGVAFQRERHRQSEAANPALATGSQLAAGVVTGAPVFGGIAPAATLAGRVAQGVGIGSGVGAVEGFTRGEGDFHQRMASAGTGAKVGGVVGGVLPVAGSVATRAAGAAQQYLGPTYTRLTQGADEAAEQILANRIHRSGQTPASVRRDLQTGQARSSVLHGGGQTASRAELPEAMADTSDSLRRLTGSLYRSGGEAGDLVSETLNNRQRGLEGLFSRVTRDGTDGQHQRIMNAAERALLVRTAGTARQTERQISEQMRADGDRLYNVAYRTSEAFDLSSSLRLFQSRMRDYQPSPIRSAMNRAFRLFSDNAPGSRPITNVRLFDKAKRALDDMIEKAQRNNQGANLVRELTMFKNNLLRNVHREGANANYQTAREAWGSAAERREAIDLGRASLRENSEVSAEMFRELTAGQQQLFRLGFLESLRNAIGSKGRGHDITRVFDQNRVRQLMSEIIPRQRGRNTVFANRPERFGDLIDREARMVQTRNAALGNSMTARNQSDDAAFAGDALASMWNRFRSSPSLFNMGVEAIGAGIQRVFGYRQDVAVALARRLLETDPTVRNQILRRLQRRSPQRYELFTDYLDRSMQTLSAAAPAALVADGH